MPRKKARKTRSSRREEDGVHPQNIFGLDIDIINCFNPKNPGQNSFPVLTQEFKR